VQGGKDILANKPKGATVTLEKDLEVKPSLPMTTSWISPWEGCCQWGVRGAMFRMFWLNRFAVYAKATVYDAYVAFGDLCIRWYVGFCGVLQCADA